MEACAGSGQAVDWRRIDALHSAAQRPENKTNPHHKLLRPPTSLSHSKTTFRLHFRTKLYMFSQKMTLNQGYEVCNQKEQYILVQMICNLPTLLLYLLAKGNDLFIPVHNPVVESNLWGISTATPVQAYLLFT